MEKYWFITYRWKQSHFKNWEYSECCSDVHPLQWLVEARKLTAENERENDVKPRYKEEYNLISWSEISEELYNKYKDDVG